MSRIDPKAELAALVGKAGVAADAAALDSIRRDFGGHDLGRPVAIVRPRGVADLVKLVKWARKRKTPLVALGSRTSFWASTRLRGRVALDMSAMSKVLAFDPAERTVRAEAGIRVRDLDAALAAKGLTLPAAPDGFGTATLASLVTNDTVAGHGMYEGPASRHVVELRAVLGTGQVLRVGASALLAGLPAFSRAGLPDLLGPLLASEGGLAIIADLTLRASPVPRVRSYASGALSSPDSFARLVHAAQKVRSGGQCHAWVHHSMVSGRDQLLVQVASEVSEAELDAKAQRVLQVINSAGIPEPKRSPANPPKWQLEPPGAVAWKGVSIAVPYANAGKVYGLWLSTLRPRVAEYAPKDDGFLRTYFGADGCASLIGWTHAADARTESACATLEAELRRRLAPFGIPYRAGTVWREQLKGRVDRAYLKMLGRLKETFDPDGILNPGVGLWP